MTQSVFRACVDPWKNFRLFRIDLGGEGKNVAHLKRKIRSTFSKLLAAISLEQTKRSSIKALY